MDDIYKQFRLPDAAQQAADYINRLKNLVPRSLADQIESPYLTYLRSLNDSFAQPDSPLRQIREAIASYATSSSTYLANLAAYRDESSLSYLVGLQKSIAEQFSSLPKFDYLPNLASQVADLQRQLIDTLPSPSASWLGSLYSAEATWLRTALLPKYLDDWGDLGPTLGSMVSRIKDILASLPEEEENVDDEELKALVADKGRQIVLAFRERKPQKTLSDIWRLFDTEILGKLPSSAQVILLNVFSGLLTALILVGFSGVRELRHSKPTIVKEFRVAIRQIDPVIARELPYQARVVIAPILIVRLHPAQRSPQVGRLYAGDVIFLEAVRKRSWSLVEYRDDEGEVAIRGWVFSRYIASLNGGRRMKMR